VKVVQINAVCGTGSTGKICTGISRCLTENGIGNYILCACGESDFPQGIRYTDDDYIKRQAIRSRLLGNYGFNSKAATERLITELERLSPDIVHLHNLHSHNCDLDALYSYFKRKSIKLIWTFHDCWAFTAYCPYFDAASCERWKTGCHDCPQIKSFSLICDRSQSLYLKKKELFTGLDLTIVTPSEWMAGLVRQSFFKDYPVRVIRNGIDLSVFRPRASDFREKYDIPPEKKIILGVAFGWSERKGLDTFVSMAEMLDDEMFQVVLVGSNERTDRRLPKSIISIHRTENQQELAEIYSVADFFINPTREDNYPTVNMEAMACGTPVLTFPTGGSPEALTEGCGAVLSRMSAEAVVECLNNSDLSFSAESCIKRAQEFRQEDRYREYLSLYRSVIHEE